MQIGRFWGFTAPMLVLASPDVEKMQECISLLNTNMNSGILQDLRAELCVLERAGQLVAVDCSLPDGSLLASGDWVVQDGEFVFNGSKSDLQQIQAVNELSIMLAGMIVKGERRGKFVSLNGNGGVAEQIYTAVADGLNGKSFPSSSVKRVLREIYNNMEKGDKPVAGDLAEALGLKCFVPDVLVVDGKEIQVSEPVKTACNYYISKMHTIQQLRDITTVVTMKEEQVFNTSFFHLVNRNPESLLYMVLNQFEHVKTVRQTASVIKNIITETIQSIDSFKVCLDKYVSVYSNCQQDNVLSRESFQKIISSFSEEKFEFFESLVRQGFSYSDWLITDFKLLGWLYDLTDSLSVEAVCKKLGVDVTDFDSFVDELCSLGIYGVNAFQKELFRDSIRSISLSTGDNILKSQEEMDSIYGVLDLIDSLLDSLLPIGAEL